MVADELFKGNKEENKGESTPKKAAKSKRKKVSINLDGIVESTGLLRTYKAIRDAVHGDIELTRIETLLIDTKEFQRLRGIKQLGTTYLVYPSARHTRFEHSLGTLFMTQKIIDIINNSFLGISESGTDSQIEISPYELFILRLVALLHDLAHIPFGHTLEDEVNIFDGEKQWTDKARFEFFLGEGKAIPEILKKELGFGDDGFYKQVIRDIRRTLKCIEGNTPEELDKPYLADIVGNTLCSDLLDYLKRDMYFTGIKETYDEKLLSYLSLQKVNGKIRLVLKLTKRGSSKIRRDCLSELLHLLRLRYSLAEKVNFHHTKNYTSAMITAAITDTYLEYKRQRIEYKSTNKDKDEDGEWPPFKELLYRMSDDELIKFLRDDRGDSIPTQRSQYIINRFERRDVYKPIYELSDLDPTFYGSSQFKRLISDLKKPDFRNKLERRLEDGAGLPEGSVVIYCPSKKMGSKPLRVFVEAFGTKTNGDLVKVTGELYGERFIFENVKTTMAEIVGGDALVSEITTSIVNKHLRLWQFYVLVDRELMDEEEKMVFLYNDIFKYVMLKSTNEMINEKYLTDSEIKPLSLRYQERYIKNELPGSEIVSELSFDDLNSTLSDMSTRADGAFTPNILMLTFDDFREIMDINFSGNDDSKSAS